MQDNLNLSPEEIKQRMQNFRVSLAVPTKEESSSLLTMHSITTIADAYNEVNSRYWGNLLRRYSRKSLFLYILDDYLERSQGLFPQKIE